MEPRIWAVRTTSLWLHMALMVTWLHQRVRRRNPQTRGGRLILVLRWTSVMWKLPITEMSTWVSRVVSNTVLRQCLGLCDQLRLFSPLLRLFLSVPVQLCRSERWTLLFLLPFVSGWLRQLQVHYNFISQTIFTARWTIVQSAAVLRLHVVRPSVCDVGGPEAHRWQLLENNCTDN